MILNINYSRVIHYLAIASLLLPFFYTGCNDEVVEGEPSDTEIVDAALTDTIGSTAETETASDMMTEDAGDSTLVLKANSALTNGSGASEDQLSERMSDRSPWLRRVLVSKNYTFSGLAIVLDSVEYLRLFALFVFALLLVMGLIMKYLHRTAFGVHVFIDLIAILFLLIAHPSGWQAERLWGFWVCLSLVSILCLIDAILLIKSRIGSRE